MKLAFKPVSQSSSSACQVSRDAGGNIVATWTDKDGKNKTLTFIKRTAADLENSRIKAYPILIP